MIYCDSCKKEVHPVKTLSGLGMVAAYGDACAGRLQMHCPHCNALLLPPSPPARLPPPRAVTISHDRSETNVLQIAQDRLAFCEAEIARLKKFEVEARQLRAMLAAAQEAIGDAS